MTTVIFPVLAKSFTFLRGPVFNFSARHYLSHVNEADHGTILRFCPNDYQGLLTSRFRCVYFESEQDISDEDIVTNGQLLAYTLNCFSSLDALAFPFSIVIKDVGRRKTATFKVGRNNQLLGTSVATQRYRLIDGTGAKDLQKFFSLTSNAIAADPRVNIMMDRFNSALRRDRLEDKIIDLSVALETMLDETAEISFRLSLYLAFVSQQNRETAYDLFKTLYDVRSRIVHGSSHLQRSQRAIGDIEGRMPDLLRYSKAAMLYYYTFLNQPPPRDWSKHCLGLVLGSTEPIV
jgi:hypothetical protein